jgi:hypothetical protein
MIKTQDTTNGSTTMTTERPKIEHCGNAVYAVRTEAGPAIYPTLDDALAAIRSGSVEVSEGDSEYYAARTWHEVSTLDDAVPVATISLLDYANDRDHVVLYWASVGVPRGSDTPLGYPEIDFADRNGLLELTGTVDEDGDWVWDCEGDPRDDQRNTITRLYAGPARGRWEAIVAQYETGE